MRAITILTVLGVLLASNETAHALERDAPFTVLCVGDKSVGFNWGQGNWKSTNFVPETFMIERVATASDECQDSLREKGNNPISPFDFPQGPIDFLNFEQNLTRSCYRIGKVGTNKLLWPFRICTEAWQPGSPESLLGVACEGFNSFTFVPNGRFHQASVHADLGDKPSGIFKDTLPDYKDSLSVSVGKCSLIQ